MVWSYTGADGPDQWGTLAAGCQPGPTGSQSPINIEPSNLVPVVPATAGAVELSYQPTAFEVENNGHTIEAVPDDKQADYITIDGERYYLQQFHFHNPSEHTVDGESFPMEVHFVNKADDGHIAVLGVPLATGSENAALSELFSKMPATKTDEQSMVALEEKINPADVIPVDSQVARYSGSLTTPPCSEPVEWSVFLTPSSISDAQAAAFNAIFADNHRPTQPLNGRVVNEVQEN